MAFKLRTLALGVSLFGMGIAPLTFAQDDDDAPPTVAPPAQAAKSTDTKVNKGDEYQKAIKDLQRTDGVLTMFVRKKEILLQLNEADLGKLLFVQTTLNTGGNAMGLQAGDPVGAADIDVFQFERHEDSVWLVVPNQQFRWNPDDPLAIASQRSFPKAILSSFRIEQTFPEKKLLLVNITNLFYGDVMRLPDLVNASNGSYMLDREKCLIAKVKSFPENAIVQMQLHFYSSRGTVTNPLLELLGLTSPSQLEDSRSLPLGVSFNLWWRKDTGYKPRLFDDRVGYFTDDFFSVGKFSEPDRTEHYINRFQLKKKDPDAKSSEPVKPIVWTIDPSIPPKYRQAVKEGVLMWNQAFAALGYQNAIQVQDAPVDADYDHADGRLNVIRWTISPDLNGAYAIAQFRTDPFTGEILNAAVSMDANYLTAAFEDHLRNVMDTDISNVQQVALDSQLKKAGWGRMECAYSKGLSASARFAWNTAQAVGTRISRDDFARQLIRETICHEVGHCLGLRHNFIGSDFLTTQQLGDDQLIDQKGDTASVMDYTPTNIMAALKGNGRFFTPVVGVYDRWAIQYGYSDVKATTPTDERYALSRIASQSGTPGLAYMTDENADSWDPYVMRFDHSSNPLEYTKRTLYAARLTRRFAIEKLPKPGESYVKRTNLILGSITQTYSQCLASAVFIGGVHANRNHRGDRGETATLIPVSPKLQRQALSMILDNCLAVGAMTIPTKVLDTLSMDPDSAQGSSWNAPLRRLLSLRNGMLLSILLRNDLLNRIAENELKMAGQQDIYTVQEHLSKVFNAVFTEIGTNRSISPNRRDLQRSALTAYVNIAGSPADTGGNDGKAIASHLLRSLSARLAATTNSLKVDATTRIHLRDMRETLHRFLARIATAK